MYMYFMVRLMKYICIYSNTRITRSKLWNATYT